MFFVLVGGCSQTPPAPARACADSAQTLTPGQNGASGFTRMAQKSGTTEWISFDVSLRSDRSGAPPSAPATCATCWGCFHSWGPGCRSGQWGALAKSLAQMGSHARDNLAAFLQVMFGGSATSATFSHPVSRHPVASSQAPGESLARAYGRGSAIAEYPAGSVKPSPVRNGRLLQDSWSWRNFTVPKLSPSQ